MQKCSFWFKNLVKLGVEIINFKITKSRTVFNFSCKTSKVNCGFSSFWSICCLFFFYTGASVRSAWALTRDRKAVCGKPVGTSLFKSSLASGRCSQPLTRDAKVGAPWQVGLTASFAFRCRPLTHLVRPCNAWPIAWPILLPIAWPITWPVIAYPIP